MGYDANDLALEHGPEAVREALRNAKPVEVPRLFFPAAELAGKPVPEREWLVRNFVPMNTVTLFGGDGGTGKSTIAQQLTAACALDRQWLHLPTKPGKAVYLTAEDDENELHRRLCAMAEAEGVTLADLGNLYIRSLAGDDALLATQGRGAVLEPTPLYDELDDYISRIAPVVVVLDTLADLFPGNENDRAQARQFVGLVRGLAIRHRCAVVMLSHPSLTGLSSGSGSSGSTAWNNSVRSRLYLERIVTDGYEPDPLARRLSTKKANYGPTGQELTLRWRDGVFMADEPETGLDRMVATHKAERVFLKLLQQFTEQGRTVNSNAGAKYAPKLMAEHPEAEGVTKRAFKAAMDALFHSRKIRIEEDGPPSRRTTYIVEVK